MAALPEWRDRPLADLLAAHGLARLPETDFPTDGWSGATFTAIDRGDRRFIVKRTSWEQDWIARATLDARLREPWFAAVFAGAAAPEGGAGPEGGGGSVSGGQPPVAYLGAARDDDGRAAILLPDLSSELIAWDRP